MNTSNTVNGTSEPKEVPVTTDIPVTEENADTQSNRFVEQVEVAVGQLVDRIKELVAEGNVRRLVIRLPDERVLVDIPLTAGAAIGGVMTLALPALTVLGALGALIARVTIEITREVDDDKGTE